MYSHGTLGSKMEIPVYCVKGWPFGRRSNGQLSTRGGGPHRGLGASRRTTTSLDQPKREQVSGRMTLSKSLEEVRRRATVRSEAYRLRLLGPLQWANLVFMVLPATLATAAAVFAAGPNNTLGAWLAGASAVLTVVHKTLKCDEYQAECLRLHQRYRSIATLAESSLENEGKSDPDLPSPQKLIAQFAELEESAAAVLPDSYIRDAEKSLRDEEDRNYMRASGAEPPHLERIAGA